MEDLVKHKLIALHKFHFQLAKASKQEAIDLLQAAGIISQQGLLADNYGQIGLPAPPAAFSGIGFESACRYHRLGYGHYVDAFSYREGYLLPSLGTPGQYLIGAASCLDLDLLTSLSQVQAANNILKTALRVADLEGLFEAGTSEIFLLRADCASIELLHHLLSLHGYEPYAMVAEKADGWRSQGPIGSFQVCVRQVQDSTAVSIV